MRDLVAVVSAREDARRALPLEARAKQHRPWRISFHIHSMVPQRLAKIRLRPARTHHLRRRRWWVAARYAVATRLKLPTSHPCRAEESRLCSIHEEIPGSPCT